MPPELLLLDQICTKSLVGWGFAPYPTGELIALPRPLSWFRGWDPQGRGKGSGGKGRVGVGGIGTIHSGREWNGGKDGGWEGREGEGKEGEGRERK